MGKPPDRFMGLPLIFEDGFDRSSAQWRPTDPASWKFMRDGERTVLALFKPSSYRPRVRSPYGIAVRQDVRVSDFVLDVWVRSTTPDYAHRDACFFFGHQDPEHFYYVHLGLKSDGSSNTIHIVNAAERTPIVKTRTDGTHWSEGYHHVRIVRNVEKGTIEAYFDDMDRTAMTAEDRTFRWGRIGLGSFDDTASFDRIILWGRKVSPAATATAPAE